MPSLRPRLVRTLLIGVSLILIASGCSDSPQSKDLSPDPAAGESSSSEARGAACAAAGPAVYFGQAASGARVERRDGDTNLTLDGVRTTSWFTDRPERDAGAMSTVRFAELFGDPASAVPHVALVTMSDGDTVRNHVVLLDLPRWDETDESLQYRVEPLQPADEPLTSSEGPVSVVVDSDPLATSCGEGVGGLVFAQTGSAASITEDAADTRLVINDPHPTLFFGGGEDRVAGSISPEALLDDWNQAGFSDDPPNAYLSFTTGADSPPELVAVEISDPQLDTTTLTFAVGSLPGIELPTGELEMLTLFIDDAATDSTSVIVQQTLAAQTNIQQAMLSMQQVVNEALHSTVPTQQVIADSLHARTGQSDDAVNQALAAANEQVQAAIASAQSGSSLATAG